MRSYGHGCATGTCWPYACAARLDSRRASTIQRTTGDAASQQRTTAHTASDSHWQLRSASGKARTASGSSESPARLIFLKRYSAYETAATHACPGWRAVMGSGAAVMGYVVHPRGTNMRHWHWHWHAGSRARERRRSTRLLCVALVTPSFCTDAGQHEQTLNLQTILCDASLQQCSGPSHIV